MNNVKSFLRYSRDGGFKSAWQFLRSSDIKQQICKLEFPSTSKQEIHVLVGGDRIVMALWMIYSWHIATGQMWSFVIHDDGTLTDSQMVELKQLMPGCRIIGENESTPFVNKRLADFPLCQQCRNFHPLGRKLFDFLAFESEPLLLAIDSDILFFRKPDQLLDWMENPTGAVFMKDVADATLLTPEQAQEMLGINLTKQVNTGIIGIPTAAIDLEWLEACLEKTNLLSFDAWFVEQTLYALLGARTGQCKLLNDEYEIPVFSSDEKAVARHYVGAIRHEFYSDGLFRIRNLMSKRLAS